jgi:hypothetical protein
MTSHSKTSGTVPLIKKGRGRPKGSTNKRKKEMLDSIQVESASSEDDYSKLIESLIEEKTRKDLHFDVEVLKKWINEQQIVIDYLESKLGLKK